jgi:hypothetical protein
MILACPRLDPGKEEDSDERRFFQEIIITRSIGDPVPSDSSRNTKGGVQVLRAHDLLGALREGEESALEPRWQVPPLPEGKGMNMAPKNWTRIIHVAKAKCGLDDEAYCALLEGAAGVSSSAEITTPEQFASVMSCFERLGFKSSHNESGPRKWPCTAAQQKKILYLWKLSARNPTEQALAAFVRRISGIEKMEWLNTRVAQSVILALTSLARQAGYDPDTGKRLAIVEAARS